MSDLSQASRWRRRAEEIRAVVARMKTEDARQPMLTLAADLDRMAEQLERPETFKG